jgi:hypothetical protein
MCASTNAFSVHIEDQERRPRNFQRRGGFLQSLIRIDGSMDTKRLQNVGVHCWVKRFIFSEFLSFASRVIAKLRLVPSCAL